MLHHQVLKMTKWVTVYTKLTIQLNTTDCLGPRSGSVASGCELQYILPHKAKPAAAESRPWLPYQKKKQTSILKFQLLVCLDFPHPPDPFKPPYFKVYSREDWKRSSQSPSHFTTATTSHTSIKREIKFHISFVFKLFFPVYH